MKNFTVAFTYRKTRKSEFCNGACTFASQILLQDKLEQFKQRVQELKKNPK